MDQDEARRETEAFLQKYLEDNDHLRAMPPLPRGTEGERALPFRLKAVIPGPDAQALEVQFKTDFAFEFTDPAVHRRANHCLSALHRARADLRAFTFEISVEGPEAKGG
jgi:hypothetical protein